MTDRPTLRRDAVRLLRHLAFADEDIGSEATAVADRIEDGEKWDQSEVPSTGQPDPDRAEALRLMMEGTDSDTGDVWLHRQDAETVFAALRSGSLSAGPPPEMVRRHSYSDGRRQPWDTCSDENHAVDLHRLLWAGSLSAGPLDVERLAEAWDNVMDGRRIGDLRLHPGIHTDDDWLTIAEEYARLGSGATSDGEPNG